MGEVRVIKDWDKVRKYIEALSHDALLRYIDAMSKATDIEVMVRYNMSFEDFGRILAELQDEEKRRIKDLFDSLSSL